MSQLMRARWFDKGGGKNRLISSIHSHPVCEHVAYNAGKAGINHMAFTIAAELIPHKINVNVIEPGWIDTPGEHEAFGDDFMSRRTPEASLGTDGNSE